MCEFLESRQNDIRHVSSITEERVELHYKKLDNTKDLSPKLIFIV